MDAYSREPCPFRIADDIGSAFTMGLIGGSIFHSLGASRNAAKGQKLLNAVREVRMRGPLTGVQFAAWGGMFSTIDCCMVAVRKKEDAYNAIFSGAATGALLAVRSGPGVMVGSALLGGTILAMIEGVQVLMGKMLSQQYDMTQQMAPLDDPKSLPSKPSSSISSPSGKNAVNVNFDGSSAATPFGMGG